MIAVPEWVTSAFDRLGDVTPLEVEQASDELVIALRDEKLEVQDIGAFLAGTERRLFGRESAETSGATSSRQPSSAKGRSRSVTSSVARREWDLQVVGTAEPR